MEPTADPRCRRCGDAGLPGGCPGCGVRAADDIGARYPELAADALAARLARARAGVATARITALAAIVGAAVCAGMGWWRVVPLVLAALAVALTGLAIGRRSVRELEALRPPE